MTTRLPKFALAVAAAALLGHALSIRVPVHKETFFSDEATYYAMAYSLAFDGDIRYEAKDLERVYDRGHTAGPSGIFLRRDEESGRYYYAKAFAYSLAAAPWVRLFGDNGFFVFHALLFAGVLGTGYLYLSRTAAPAVAALYAATYFLASISILYYFWITPEWFNLSIGFFATFLWLYKGRPPGWPEDAAWKPSGWLAGGWTDFGAAALYGVAAYSKPPSAILVGPLLVWMLLRRRGVRAVALGLVFAAVILGMFGATDAITGDWNYMGGDRRSFTGPYPLQYSHRPWETIGTPMITEVGDYRYRIPRPDLLVADLVYVWVGRNGGVLVYMLPAVLAALAFMGAAGRRWLSPHTLLLAAVLLSALAYMTMIQTNWIGGGGTVGSRYFVSFYYAPFFAIPLAAGVLAPAIAWGVWALFLAQIVLNPFASSVRPSLHTKAFPFKLLPAEMSMLNDLPFNTNPLARRVQLRPEDPFDVYFLDDNTNLREGALGGFWVKSREEAEVVLRAASPVREMVLEVRNGPVDNTVTVTLDGQRREAALAPDESVTLRFAPVTRFRYGDNWVYRLTIHSKGGGVPMFHDPTSQDFRRLGVFISPRVELD